MKKKYPNFHTCGIVTKNILHLSENISYLNKTCRPSDLLVETISDLFTNICLVGQSDSVTVM